MPMVTMFVNRSGRNEHLYRGPSIDASYQVLAHLVKRFQRRRFFRHRPIRNKNCRWQPCLLADRDKMSNLYRGPFIDVSYHVSSFGHTATEKIFRNRPIRKRIACGGHVS